MQTSRFGELRFNNPHDDPVARRGKFADFPTRNFTLGEGRV
jgi:hypothetical protein